MEVAWCDLFKFLDSHSSAKFSCGVLTTGPMTVNKLYISNCRNTLIRGNWGAPQN